MAQTIKRREAQLVASGKRIKGVVANVPGVVYQLRATLEHVYTNKFISENATEIFGLAPDPQTIFEDFYAHIPDDEKEHYVRTIRDAVDEAKPWVYEGRFVKPTGETIWFASNAIPYVAEDAIDYYGVLLDITARKKMESSLRLTQFCFDKASVGIYRIGYDGQILEANAQACRNLGYTREELLHLTVFDIDPDSSPQRYTELIERLRGIRAHMIETRHKRKNGELFPVQIRLNLTEYEDQEFIVAFEEDITDRKKWQRDLEESERRYRSLFDGAPMMYVVAAAKGNEPVIQNANNMFLETLGYQRDEVVGTPMSRYYTDDSKRELFKTGYQHALSDGSQSVERELVTRDKKIVHSLLRTVPDYDSDGQVISVRAMFLDITERKQALEQVHQLRNYLSNINDSMPSVLVGVDAHLKVTQWNKQAASATGIAHENAVSRPLPAVYPELMKKVRRINDAISNRQVIRLSKIVSQVEGTRRFEDVTIFPVVGDGMEGAVIRVDDVTERVRLEEMMIQNEKMLSVGGLAAGMAHEINNPLAGILQNAVVVKNRLTGDLPGNHKAADAAGTTMAAIQAYMQQRNLLTLLENIRDSGQRAATIVRNMLSFVRKSDRAVSSHDLTVLLEQTLALAQTDYDMKKRYDFKQIEIVREYDPSLPVIPCEPSKLQQVFFNILKNGAEAMAEARDKERPSRFILRVKNENQWVRVEIEDNGPGMPEAIRRRIFEPFFTTKPVGKGTGLGLSVSYFIITKNHGGQMDVDLVDGGGTRFVLRLPKEDPGVR
jgi:PAS domain S-box-containing protein